MEWFAARADGGLQCRIREARVVRRRHDPGGLFVALDFEDSPISEADRREANPWPGPFIQSPLLPKGAEGVLYVTEDGRPEALEIFTYGDEWPQELGDFELATPN